MRMRSLGAVLAALALCTHGCGGHAAGAPPASTARPEAPANAADAGAASARPDPGALRCRDRRAWGSYLGGDTRATVDEILTALGDAGVELSGEQRETLQGSLKSLVKWRLIRFLIVEGENHNFGTTLLSSVTTERGDPVRIYRSGFTNGPDRPGSCYDDLLRRGGVRHVVNLYAGVMPTQDLEVAERRAAEAAGASYFSVRDADPSLSSWRHDIDQHPDDPAVQGAAMNAVASLINRQVLRPGGNKPRGNIHIHCAGGMHRTSMIVGILHRCLGGASMQQIEADYKRHVGWRDASSPGGYEAANLDFIRAFDCSLLQP